MVRLAAYLGIKGMEEEIRKKRNVSITYNAMNPTWVMGTSDLYDPNINNVTPLQLGK